MKQSSDEKLPAWEHVADINPHPGQLEVSSHVSAKIENSLY
jgi:hypothetical protein